VENNTNQHILHNASVKLSTTLACHVLHTFKFPAVSPVSGLIVRAESRLGHAQDAQSHRKGVERPAYNRNIPHLCHFNNVYTQIQHNNQLPSQFRIRTEDRMRGTERCVRPYTKPNSFQCRHEHAGRLACQPAGPIEQTNC